MRAVVVALVLAVCLSGCSFVRSSKIKTCKHKAPFIVDTAATIVTFIATPLIAIDSGNDVLYVGIPVGTAFMISMFYGIAKWAPPKGMRCVN